MASLALKGLRKACDDGGAEVALVERLGDATRVHARDAGLAMPLIVLLPGYLDPIAVGDAMALHA